MAVPSPDLGLVGTLAAGLRLLIAAAAGILLALLAWPAASAAAASPMPATSPIISPTLPTGTPRTPSPTPSPAPTSTPTPAPTPTPTPTPTATPTPFSPQLNLTPASGPARTSTRVTGVGYGRGQQVSIYLEKPDSPLGRATADQQGSFQADVTIDSGVGRHSVCADAPGPVQACAYFTVAEAQSPSPTASAASPTPSAEPTATASPVPALPAPSDRPGALTTLVTFPYVLFPVLLLAGLTGLAVFALRSRAAPAEPVGAATVVHRSVRPAAPPPPLPSPPPPARPPASGPEGPPDLPQPGD